MNATDGMKGSKKSSSLIHCYAQAEYPLTRLSSARTDLPLTSTPATHRPRARGYLHVKDVCCPVFSAPYLLCQLVFVFC